MARKGQQYFAGVEPVRVEELDTLAEAHRAAVKKLTAARKKRDAAQEALVEAMHRHELAEYQNDELKVVLKSKGESVSVKEVDNEVVIDMQEDEGADE